MPGIPISDERTTRLRSLFDRCYGCGTQNAIGLHIGKFTGRPDGAEAPFTPGNEFNGFHGILHGGVIATALDEISVWSAVLAEGVFVFTAKLEIRYRTKARIGDALTLEGTVKRRMGKKLLIDATMRSGETVTAESSGLFIVADTVDNLLDASGAPTAR